MPTELAADRKLAGIGDDAVRNATGHGWDDWLELLDRAGAEELDHKGIVAVLGDRRDAPSGWWRQMIAVAYEQARGLRQPHQRTGGFAAGASKTIGAPVSVVYTAWTDPRLRSRWLRGARYQVSKAAENKSLRIRWGDGTQVGVYFVPAGASKSQVTVEHEKLSDAAAVAKAKNFWKTHLEELADLVAGSRTPGNSRAATGPVRTRGAAPRTRGVKKTATARGARKKATRRDAGGAASSRGRSR